MNRNIAFLGLTLLGCTSASEPKCPTIKGYIYDSSIDGRAEVFNLKSLIMSIQSKRDADINRSDSEFAGPIVNCSSKVYLCMSGSLNVTVPRELPLTAWSFNGLNCKRLRDDISTDQVSIECAEGKKPPSIKAKYSKSRGILSYRRQNLDDEAVFRVRGRCGLFASE
jgi:hypothetical protein